MFLVVSSSGRSCAKDAREMSSCEYKPIPGWPGYEVGSDGTVWSAKSGQRVPKIATYDSHRGYCFVHLWDRNTRKKFWIHTLVLVAFSGPRPDRYECHHLNGNKLDNRIDNLKWGTKRRNILDGYRLGERRFKLGMKKATEIRRLYRKGTRVCDLAKQYNVNESAIRKVIKRQVWVDCPECGGSKNETSGSEAKDES